MRVDLARALRRIKPEQFSGTLRRRADSALQFADDAPTFGPPLLLDTCVYIDGLAGDLPYRVRALLRTRTLMHLSVVLGELAHNFGRLDPKHPQTPGHLRELAGVIDDIPRHRLDDAVSAATLLEAGILSGLMFRLGGAGRGQELATLNDATIFVHALANGYTVLSRNIRDFDLLGQIVPAGRVLFYREGR